MARSQGDQMSRRDYSLFGADGKRAVEIGLTAAEWYHTEVPRKVMKDLMARSDQPAIRDTIILLLQHDRPCRHRHRALAFALVSTVLAGLRSPLRLSLGLALARMRARHCLQDALDEQRRLPNRQLHDHAQLGHLAVEPCAPPFRNLSCRPRPRNRRDAPAGSGEADLELLWHPGRDRFLSPDPDATQSRAHRGRDDLRARKRVGQSAAGRHCLCGDLRRRPSRLRSGWVRSCP